MMANGRILAWIGWPIITVATTLLCGSHSTLLRLSKENGSIRYRISSAVFLTDIMKLGISLILLWSQQLHMVSPVKSQSSLWLVAFCVPALLGVINNHISHHLQHLSLIDPISFQLLSNLKIVTTATVYWLIMRKAIGFRRQLGLTLMVLSGVFNSFAGHADQMTGLTSSDRLLVTPLGLLLMAVLCTISGFSSVFLEFIMKRNKQPILIQNCLLYSFASLFTGVSLVHQYIAEGSTTVSQPNFLSFLLHGFSTWTWVSILSQTACGLLMGVVIKFSSNLLRLIIIACAVPVASVLGVLCFSLQLNALFGLAVTALFFALYFYSTSKL